MSDKPVFYNYVAAGYPLLWIQTHEEFRAMTSFAKELSQSDEEYTLYSWDRVQGIKLRVFEDGVLKSGQIEGEGLDDPLVALSWAGAPDDKGMGNNSILFLQDYHHYIKKDMITRKIRNLIPYFKATGKVLAIISHSVELPPEIEKEVTPIQFKLPDIKELRIVLKGLSQAAKRDTKIDPYPKDNDRPILEAALGMTSFEAENAFALSLREVKAFDVNIINREKAAIVKKTELLEVVDVKETLEDVGGLDNVKKWLLTRENNFTEKAREYGLKPPKGLLMGGLPGTGKSLTAKCTAAVLKRPLLRLDIGKVFGSFVGESESNIRKCLDIADAVAPCVLWVDELEKAFSGTKGGASNKGGGEVSMRVYSTFLTWLQEKTSDVFLVATANDVSAIDEALLSRINCIFWVDLPDEKQREEIIAIHLRKIGRDPEKFNLKKLAQTSDKFSGREIETWIALEALPYAFSKDHELCDRDLFDVAEEVVPQAIMMAEDIQRYRTWAKEHKMKPASSQMKEVKIPVALKKDSSRKMSLGSGDGQAN